MGVQIYLFCSCLIHSDHFKHDQKPAEWLDKGPASWWNVRSPPHTQTYILTLVEGCLWFWGHGKHYFFFCVCFPGTIETSCLWKTFKTFSSSPAWTPLPAVSPLIHGCRYTTPRRIVFTYIFKSEASCAPAHLQLDYSKKVVFNVLMFATLI